MPAMPHLLVAVVLLLLLASGHSVSRAAGDEWGYGRCDMALEAWATDALQELSKLEREDHRELKELLFFLHVPRTGGRTYHQCLLRHLYRREEHCDGSYDKLRFNSSKHCRLLVTHDDYSVLSKLPMASTSVITIMRHPIERIFSAYEFSVEVGSRFFARNQRRKTKVARATNHSGSNTLNIWPWSSLVPWMRDDLISRQIGRHHIRASSSVYDIDHYNASAYAMPLHEFIQQPIVMDILHNGATFQVAGLANNSYFKGAAPLRKCVIKYPNLGHYILNVAKRRMDHMLFVGLTDKHKDTATLFAHIIGGQLFPLGMPSNSSTNSGAGETDVSMLRGSNFGLVNLSEHKSMDIGPQTAKFKGPFQQGPPSQNLTVYSLIATYENCASHLRGTQIQRRIVSLKNALPLNFSTEARFRVAEVTLEGIREMNNLDIELYAYARFLYSQRGETSRTPKSLVQTKDSKTSLANPIVDEGSYWLHSPLYNSRKLMFMVLLFVCGGAFTLGARMVLFSTRNRLVTFKVGQNHEKF